MLNPNHPAVLKAAAVSGLSGDALLEKALLIGLKQIAKPKAKVVRVKTKANPDSAPRPAVVRLTADDIRKQFLENRKRGVFTENGFTPEFEERVLQNIAASKKRKNQPTYKNVYEADAAILGRAL